MHTPPPDMVKAWLQLIDYETGDMTMSPRRLALISRFGSIQAAQRYAYSLDSVIEPVIPDPRQDQEKQKV